MLGSQPNHGLATLLSSLIARQWVRLQTLWRVRLKDLSIDEMVGAWCFGYCQAHRVYLLDFFCSGIQSYLLLSPYLCFISFFKSWFICSRRWCIDKLRGLSCKPNFYVSWSTSELRVRLVRHETGLCTPVKYFYWLFQGGTSFVDHLFYLCFVFVSWSTSEPRMRLAHNETRISPLVNYFYWSLQVGASFVDNLCFVLFLLCFRAR